VTVVLVRQQVDIILADGKSSENSLLKIDQLVNSVLDRNFSGLTVRFNQTGRIDRSAEELRYSHARRRTGDNHSVVRDFFTCNPMAHCC